MRLSRALLRPLTPLYAAGVELHQMLIETGRLRTQTPEEITLSVGSLSAGGAGKTPMVLALARSLMRLEIDVRILSRGYGRRSSETLVVDPKGTAEEFGDEPLLLAQRADVPVVVGRSRYEAGLLAASLPSVHGTTVHLLDDGFQHRALCRDLDLVLLTARDVADTLLPAGNLREPISALRRADVLLLREEEAPGLQRLVRALPSNRETRPVLLIRRSLSLDADLPRPARPFLFSGIARPGDLPPMLGSVGLPAPVGQIDFPDHHRYTSADLGRIVAAAGRCRADGLITTEKDAVKLSPSMRAQLAAVGPMLVPELVVQFADERAALAEIFAMVPRLSRRGRLR